MSDQNQQKLFDIPDQSISSGNTCNSCVHRQRWQCNSKVIQYCGVRKSNRTENGLLKIKCKDKACTLFEKEKEKEKDQRQ